LNFDRPELGIYGTFDGFLGNKSIGINVCHEKIKYL